MLLFPFQRHKDWRRRLAGGMQQQQQQMHQGYGQQPPGQPTGRLCTPREVGDVFKPCPTHHRNLITDSRIGCESQDENAPDLYIPAMAFVTYILVAGDSRTAVSRTLCFLHLRPMLTSFGRSHAVGFTMGVSESDKTKFDPAMLGRTSSFGIVFWVLEVRMCAVKIKIGENQ